MDESADMKSLFGMNMKPAVATLLWVGMETEAETRNVFGDEIQKKEFQLYWKSCVLVSFLIIEQNLWDN